MLFLEPIFWLAMNLYHEARGESVAGQVAVAHVVINRAQKRGKSLKEIILQPYQFSWANSGARPSVDEYEAMLQCFESAAIALNERLEGKNFKGADHYHEKHMKPFPKWATAPSMKLIATVGNHIFYKDA